MPPINRTDNAFAALGYDTLGLIADAIQRAGSADPAKIRDALAATKCYQGVTGSIPFPPARAGRTRRCRLSASRTRS
jgi:ABC-type branched-subunit amino acid transport system substrate-binding protein